MRGNKCFGDRKCKCYKRPGSLVACTTATYTIGGTVSGLAGTGLVLQDNGKDNLPISANGSFTFATPIIAGSAYSVTILSQPSNPAQTCVASNGTGTATTNVTSVQVNCPPAKR